MLAAMSPAKDGALGTLKLILQMEAAGQGYSRALEDYLEAVIKQSLQLVEKPEAHAGEALVEALSLALHVRSDDGLRQSLESILKGEVEKAASASGHLDF
tara:strand:- start:25 stop:324 length:300 start_codon:yes stop_codon:yes gene_type:complete